MPYDKFKKAALRKLSEQYLVRTILVTEIYEFLKNHTKLNPTSISNVLTEKAGKSRNNFYKDKNRFANYSTSSFLRYWRAMLLICEEQKVEQHLLPKLDELLEKYSSFIDFISQIAIEDDLDILIENNIESIWTLYATYRIENTQSNLLTLSEKDLLDAIEQHHMIQQKLNEKKSEQLERMKQK